MLMALFKRKPVSEKIHKKWVPKTCSLSRLEEILLEEDLIELWVKYGTTYFQIGSSSDSNRQGFFDKVYYINLHTERSLFKLLNGPAVDDGFFYSKEVKPVFDSKLVGGRPITEIWPHCTIVGVDGMNPAHYLRPETK